MGQREFDEPSTTTGHDESLEALDRRPDLSELFEGEAMSAGRRVIQEGRAREKLSHPDGRHPDALRTAPRRTDPRRTDPRGTNSSCTVTEVADAD